MGSHHCLTVFLAQLQDPIDASPAVLVKRYDITEQKELELKLSVQQQELQRCEPALLSHVGPICLALHFYNCSSLFAPSPPQSTWLLCLLQPYFLLSLPLVTTAICIATAQTVDSAPHKQTMIGFCMLTQ